MRVTKTLRFCAAHRLTNHKGRCKNLHGHNYRVDVTLEAKERDDNGMVCDFGRIKARIGEWIDDNWDHAVILNYRDPLLRYVRQNGWRYYTFGVNDPTAEEMAAALLSRFHFVDDASVVRVRVWETEDSYAEAVRPV